MSNRLTHLQIYHAHLFLEASTLFEGIVQLRVGVAEFLPAHETLEAFA
jgi:hypothetical protein